MTTRTARQRPDVARELVDRVRGRMDRAPGQADLARHVTAAAVAQGRVLGVGDLRAAVGGVRDHTWGLGPLQALVDDPSVTDVLVNGGDTLAGGRAGVWVDRGAGLSRIDLDIGDEAQVRALAVRLAAAAGRRLDEGVPWADARLPGGIRLHAVIPPVAPEGTHLSLRVLRAGRLDLDGLVKVGSVPAAWRELLIALVRQRCAFLVTGGTGVGKTTLLSALLSLAGRHERLVLVEDVGELFPTHPHVVRLEARHANVEGRGGVGLDALVRQALRMRPDRLVVGECRGPEVRDLLAAMNTGHAGGCGTMHANAPAEVPARLEALGLQAGLGRDAVRAQAAAALDAIVHLRRGPDGLRRVVEIAAVCGRSRGDLDIRMAVRLVGAAQAEGMRSRTRHGPDDAPGRDTEPEDPPGGEAEPDDAPGGDAAASEPLAGAGGAEVVVGPGWPSLARRIGWTARRFCDVGRG